MRVCAIIRLCGVHERDPLSMGACVRVWVRSCFLCEFGHACVGVCSKEQNSTLPVPTLVCILVDES